MFETGLAVKAVANQRRGEKDAARRAEKDGPEKHAR